MTAPPFVEVVGLHHEYPSDDGATVALGDVTFSAGEGEFLAIVGPSGSGKTTLLRCLAGLTLPTRGSVRIAGRTVDSVPEGLAVVFQDYGRSLFPWLTVRGNVEMPIRRMRLPRAERDARVAGALEEVALGDTARSHPWQLSGGMQQRVAIARALAIEPRILLLDEPFASVDAQTRADLQDTVLDVWARHQSTIVFVTHDTDEAVYLADRVLVLSRPPATVLREVPIDLPRPRDQIATRETPRFSVLRSEVTRLVRRPLGSSEPADVTAPGS